MIFFFIKNIFSVAIVDWYTFLKLSHIIGTVLGVGGSTFAEIFYTKFASSKKADIFEHEVLKICIGVIRIGLVILVFSGLGFLVLWRLAYLGPDVFYSSRFLAKMTVVVVLLFVALLINFRLINLELGSSISTASWYAAMILGIWRNLNISYFAILLWYCLLIFLTFTLLGFIRKHLALKK